MALRTPISQVQKSDFPGISENGYRWLDILRSRAVDFREATISIDPASMAANSVVEQTFTVAGLKVDDIMISIIKPTLTANVGVLQARVSAVDTLAIQFINTSGSPIDPPLENYTIVYIKNSR